MVGAPPLVRVSGKLTVTVSEVTVGPLGCCLFWTWTLVSIFVGLPDLSSSARKKAKVSKVRSGVIAGAETASAGAAVATATAGTAQTAERTTVRRFGCAGISRVPFVGRAQAVRRACRP